MGNLVGLVLDLFLGACLFGVFLMLRSLSLRGVWEGVAWFLFGVVLMGVIVLLLHQSVGLPICWKGVL